MVFGAGAFSAGDPPRTRIFFDPFFRESEVQKFGDPFKETRRGQLYRKYKVSAKTEPPGSGSGEISGPTFENHGFCGQAPPAAAAAACRPRGGAPRRELEKAYKD